MHYANPRALRVAYPAHLQAIMLQLFTEVSPIPSR